MPRRFAVATTSRQPGDGGGHFIYRTTSSSHTPPPYALLLIEPCCAIARLNCAPASCFSKMNYLCEYICCMVW